MHYRAVRECPWQSGFRSGDIRPADPSGRAALGYRPGNAPLLDHPGPRHASSPARGCLSEDSVTVAPDAGEEIEVIEIVRRLAGQLAPGKPIPEVRVTGARPGERLAEPLVAPMRCSGTCHCRGCLRCEVSAHLMPGRLVTPWARLRDCYPSVRLMTRSAMRSSPIHGRYGSLVACLWTSLAGTRLWPQPFWSQWRPPVS